MWPGESTFSWFGPELPFSLWFLFYVVYWFCCFRTNTLTVEVLGPHLQLFRSLLSMSRFSVCLFVLHICSWIYLFPHLLLIQMWMWSCAVFPDLLFACLYLGCSEPLWWKKSLKILLAFWQKEATYSLGAFESHLHSPEILWFLPVALFYPAF